MGFKLSNGKPIHLNKAIEELALNKLSGSEGGWIITSQELKKYFNTSEDIEVEFSNGNVFILEKIIGYSHPEWTPLVFLMKDSEGNYVANFLYMKGGAQLKGWNFVNSGIYGPSLWPTARKYLIGELIKNT